MVSLKHMKPSDTARKSSYIWPKEIWYPSRYQSRSEVIVPLTSELSTSNHSDGKKGNACAFLKSFHQTVCAILHLKACDSQITWKCNKCATVLTRMRTLSPYEGDLRVTSHNSLWRLQQSSLWDIWRGTQPWRLCAHPGFMGTVHKPVHCSYKCTEYTFSCFALLVYDLYSCCIQGRRITAQPCLSKNLFSS